MGWLSTHHPTFQWRVITTTTTTASWTRTVYWMPTRAGPCRLNRLMRWERTGVELVGLSWYHRPVPWMNHHGHGEGTSLARQARAIPMAGWYYCPAVPAGAEEQTGGKEPFTERTHHPSAEGRKETVLCLLWRIRRVNSALEQGLFIGHFHSLTSSSTASSV